MTKVSLLYSCIVLVFISLSLSTGPAHAGGIFPTHGFAKHHARSSKGDKVLYFGGPVIGNVKIYTVFWGSEVDSKTQSGVPGFYASLVDSTYLDWMDEYNTHRNAGDGRPGTGQSIARGTYGGTLTITPANTAKKLDKTDIEAELVTQFEQGRLPSPDSNSLYMIHFPAGLTLSTGGIQSCKAWCGDHEGFASKKYGNVYYAMMPDLGQNCGGCAFSGNAFDSLTIIASHEIAEAITDPMCPAIGLDPAFPAAWVAADQNEIGDLCISSRGELHASSRNYQVEGEWDNSINACKGGDFKASSQ